VHPFREKLGYLGRKTPWWGISFFVHALAILVLMNWRITVRPPETVIAREIKVGIRPPEPEKPPLDISTHKAPEPPAIEPPAEKADLKEVVDRPALDAAERMSQTQVIGVEGSPFDSRTPGGRKRATEGLSGGPGASENAVESGLLWLAAKQLATGGWAAPLEGARWADPGLSGLATMAFLGAGYTHRPGGKFTRTVDRALAYLKSQQGKDGCIAATDRQTGKRLGEGTVNYMYCHATATLALVEAYGMTKDQLLHESAQRAIDFIVRTQNSTGGWRYFFNSPDGDSSVSGWMVMALRSASLSGLDIPKSAFDNARRFFDSVTDKAEGKTCYLVGPALVSAIAQKDGQSTLLLPLAKALDPATANERVASWNLGARAFPAPGEPPEGPVRRFHITVPTDKALDLAHRVANESHIFVGYLRTGVALDAVGLLCHQYLGMAADDPFIERAGAVILANPPRWEDETTAAGPPSDKVALFTGTNNYYYWYYANLALHQRRSRAWDRWHPQVKDLLCRIQERRGDNTGSWPPLTYGGRTFGRVYSTALAILSLEVYYRYSPLYKETVDEVLAAYGDALGAYNHYARMPDKKKPEAEDARKKAIESLDRFLALSEAKSEKDDPKKTADHRGQATLALIRLHHAGGDVEHAIALLKALPGRFPNLLTPSEQVRWLADLYRARARQLTEEGDTEGARKATAAALNHYLPLVSKEPGKNPELELWLAGGFFDREEWQKAYDLYKPQLASVNFKRLDPKGEEGRTVLAILDRLTTCAIRLRLFKTAAYYLELTEKLIGSTLATRLQQAELCRLRKDYTAARRIYDALLAALPEYTKEWWEVKYEQLFMTYLEGRSDYVIKCIGVLQLSHPDLGGPDLKPRILDLLARAQNGEPSAKALPESPSQ